MHRSIDRVVDLLDPHLNELYDIDAEEARRRVLSGDPPRSANRRILRIRHRRWIDGPDGSLAGCATSSPSAGKVLRCSLRTASILCSARSRTPVSRNSFIPATRAWCLRTTWSSSRWWGVLTQTRPTRVSFRQRRTWCRHCCEAPQADRRAAQGRGRGRRRYRGPPARPRALERSRDRLGASHQR
jgi:hypothetical protein